MPDQETSIARRGPQGRTHFRGYPAYILWYVAGRPWGEASPLGEVNWTGASSVGRGHGSVND
jgi:hypothetical protein